MFVLKLVFYWRVFYGIAGESPDFVADSVQAEKLPYEEDPNNFERQRVQELLDLKQKFFMVSRTYNRSIPGDLYTCLTAQSLGRNPNDTYTLKFTASQKFAKVAIITITTSTTPYMSGKHTENNAMNFSTHPGVIPEHQYKLMYLHANKTCAVFRVQPMAVPENYFEEATELEGSDGMMATETTTGTTLLSVARRDLNDVAPPNPTNDVAEPNPDNGTTPISMDRRDSNDVASPGDMNGEEKKDVAPPTPDNETTDLIAVDRRELNDVAPSSQENGTTAPQAEVRQDIDDAEPPSPKNGMTVVIAMERRDSIVGDVEPPAPMNDVASSIPENGTTVPQAEARQDINDVTVTETTNGTTFMSVDRRELNDVAPPDQMNASTVPDAEVRQDSGGVTAIDTTTATSPPIAEARQDSMGVTATDTTAATSPPIAEARQDSTVVALPDSMNGCELLVREDVIESGWEEDCYKVYVENCGIEGQRIFDETCYEDQATAESA